MKNTLTLFAMLISGIAFSQSTETAVDHFQKGIEEKNARRYQVAANHFETAIKLDPKNIQAYIENGFVNKEMRRTDASKLSFTKAYELDNSNHIAMQELMNLYFSYRQFQNAIDFAMKCKTCPDRERIMALSYYNMEDYGKAEKGLLSIVAKDPKNAEATYTLARTYLEMGLEGKAIPYYTKATELDSKQAKWHFELGLLYYNNNNYKNAVISFNKAAENGYNRSNDFNENLGFSYLYSGQFEQGETLLNDIMSRKPGDKELIRDIASAFYDRKMYDKCLAYCQILMEMDMKDAKALYQAGMCFQKKGEKDKGQQMCDKAIELDPSMAGMRTKKGDFGG